MESHPIDNLMKNTMENLKNMIDVNTIVGNPVQSDDGTVIIPVSKVSFGFATGGSEFSCKDDYKGKYPFGGGSGGGVTLKPIAFLVVKDDYIRLLPVEHDNTYDKLVDSIPEIIDTLKDMFNKKNNKKDNKKNNNDNDNDNPSYYSINPS
jgi:sporulation protein YtfJ